MFGGDIASVVVICVDSFIFVGVCGDWDNNDSICADDFVVCSFWWLLLSDFITFELLLLLFTWLFSSSSESSS